MKLVLPSLRGQFLRGAAIRWRIAADGLQVDAIKGHRIASCEHHGRQVFVRSLVRPLGERISVQLDFRTQDAFRASPSVNATLDEFEKSLEPLIGKTDTDTAKMSLECELTWEQVALGGILSPFVVVRKELEREHHAYLHTTTFLLVGDHSDTLTFWIGDRDGTAIFDVSIDVRSKDPVSWNSLEVATTRLMPEFNRLVMGQKSVIARESTGDSENG